MKASVWQRLKDITHASHLRAERLVRILEPNVTEADYALYLERFIGFLAPVEERLVAGPLAAEPELDLPGRLKTGLLQQDLRALGRDAPALAALPRCTRLPALEERFASLGACYVLEGSTLGGQFILRHLRPRFPALAGHAFHYLEGYGPRTGERWRAFGRVLARHEADEAACQRMEAGAVETFERLGDWLEAG